MARCDSAAFDDTTGLLRQHGLRVALFHATACDETNACAQTMALAAWASPATFTDPMAI